ncbi:MAG: DUF4190 domain-containing protein [Nevskiaceae bacterium]|nr:MAG: DUF4190 domain-containing protein [Nevskiaceae bacterium]TBR72748.1 MAG: DUF4190 domain-containing protein [Nevskiaceae bacterium]
MNTPASGWPVDPPPPLQPQPRTSLAAVFSLLAGIGAWTMLPIVGALVAVICGHTARAAIRRSGGTLDGDAMAVAGLALGWLQLILASLLAALIFAAIAYGLHAFDWVEPFRDALPARGDWV